MHTTDSDVPAFEPIVADEYDRPQSCQIPCCLAPGVA
jgi:hypothetical protein